MIDILSQYGLSGVVIAGLAWYILKIEKRHKEERKEWKESDDKRSDKMIEAIDKNTSVLSGLKTLLENRK